VRPTPGRRSCSQSPAGREDPDRAVVASVGMTAVIRLVLSTVNAALPSPMLTAVAPVKLVPLTITLSPTMPLVA